MRRKYTLVSRSYIKEFGWGAGAALLGLSISVILFPQAPLILATSLTAIALIFEMTALLEENRNAIWIQQQSPWQANFELISKVVAIFGGVFIATILCQGLAPQWFLNPLSIKGELFRNQPLPLFLHNLRVLLVCVVLAFIYRSAGFLLVICWNAMVWSTALLTFLGTASKTGTKHAWFYALSVLPHLVVEAAAYVAAGLVGVFLSKAIFKYKLSSRHFLRVSRACVTILAGAVIGLWLAMELEIGLAQSVLAQLQR